MIIIAASLYLPEHISTVANRAFYYYSGDNHESTPRVVTGSGRGAANAEPALMNADGSRLHFMKVPEVAGDVYAPPKVVVEDEL